MKLEIKHQESYSRGELLLRTFFGFIYIALPHFFLMYFVAIWAAILLFLSFWVVLFTGKYPEQFFNFQVGLLRWQTRVTARIYNLSDGYPSFFNKGTDDLTTLELEYPEKLSRGLLLLRLFFGWLYVGIPHGFILFFRLIATGFLIFVSWWVVLFTGKYPESFHKFNVGTLRWTMRLNFYLYFMTDEYPPFTGKE